MHFIQVPLTLGKVFEKTFYILSYSHLIGESDHKTDEERINIRQEESLKGITILILSTKGVYSYICQFPVIGCSKLSILDIMWIIISISFWRYFRLSAVTILGRGQTWTGLSGNTFAIASTTPPRGCITLTRFTQYHTFYIIVLSKLSWNKLQWLHLHFPRSSMTLIWFTQNHAFYITLPSI